MFHPSTYLLGRGNNALPNWAIKVMGDDQSSLINHVCKEFSETHFPTSVFTVATCSWSHPAEPANFLSQQEPTTLSSYMKRNPAHVSVRNAIMSTKEVNKSNLCCQSLIFLGFIKTEFICLGNQNNPHTCSTFMSTFSSSGGGSRAALRDAERP